MIINSLILIQQIQLTPSSSPTKRDRTTKYKRRTGREESIANKLGIDDFMAGFIVSFIHSFIHSFIRSFARALFSLIK